MISFEDLLGRNLKIGYNDKFIGFLEKKRFPKPGTQAFFFSGEPFWGTLGNDRKPHRISCAVGKPQGKSCILFNQFLVFLSYFATCFFGATVDCIIFNMLYTHIGIHMYWWYSYLWCACIQQTHSPKNTNRKTYNPTNTNQQTHKHTNPQNINGPIE